MPSRYSTTNRVFGISIAIEIILCVALANRDGGLTSALLAVLAFCSVITWLLQLHIDHKSPRQPSAPLTTLERKRFEKNRLLLILVFLAMIIFAVTSK
jgi:hypothetical protein